MVHDRSKDAALLCEVADVLAQHGHLRCVPRVETGDDGIVLTVVVPVEGQDDPPAAMEALEVLNALKYLAGLTQLRAFATDYGIDPARLEALLPDAQQPAPAPCPECDGKGRVLDAPTIGQGTYMDTCPDCGGTGIARPAVPDVRAGHGSDHTYEPPEGGTR